MRHLELSLRYVVGICSTCGGKYSVSVSVVWPASALTI